MARTDHKSVDEYIAAQPQASQPTLEKVRQALRAALPDAEEVISYQIPAYRMPGGTVLHFAGWKEHYSLYPIHGELIAAFARDLEPYEYNSKGTLRFRLDERVPVRLIGRLAKFRARQLADAKKARDAAKPASPSKAAAKG
ncbi:MAG: iron chaperone [Rhizobiaceae bacterium]